VPNATEIVLIKALDGLAMRSVASAENIANASTPGYRPLRVTFEEALAAAAARGPDAVRAVQPQMVRSEDPLQAGMRLDLELVDAAGTAGRYAALVDVLSRQLQLRSMAATGGRR
jgi:flagellar basal-body rod protein FlgB